MPTDDKNLFNKIKQGDNEAFKTLLDDCNGLLFGVAYKILHNGEDAEDCVFMAYEELIIKIDCIRKPDSLKPWLVATVKHKAFDMLKKNKRSVRVTAEELTLDPDYAEVVQISEVLKSLPSDQLEALLLYNAGLKLREISALIGKPLTSTWSLIEKAKKNFIRGFKE